MSLHPNIKWSERPDTLLISVEVPDCKDLKYDFKPTHFSFSATSGGKQYTCELDLYKEIDPSKVGFNEHSRYPSFLVNKKDSGYWNFLLANKVKSRFVAVDWNTWKDEDEVDSEDESAQPGGQFDPSKFNFGNMGGMGGMGGLGGLGGMGMGMDDANWDEDDMEDLDDAKMGDETLQSGHVHEHDDEEDDKKKAEETSINSVD